MAVERVLSNLNLISFKTEGGLQNHIDELQDGDLVFTPDNSLKGNLFDFKWTDHKLNDISWLNADTFSWQSGDVYVAAFEHLVNDYISLSTGVLYAYYAEDAGETFYLYTDTPSIGDQLLDETGTPAYEAYGTHKVKEIYDDGSFARTATFPGNRFYRDASKDITLSTPKSETETISGITIRYYKADDGHKICMQDQEANVQALYEATGVAWYYIIDMINKQFKLPRTQFGFTGLRDSVGKYVPESLPNITGTLNNILGRNYNNGWTGVFSLAGNGSTYPTVTATSNDYGTKIADFSASRSSSTYQDNAPVQQRATQMYLYFYVGNFERDAIEQTAGITSEMFNNKADVSTVESLRNAENFTATGKATLSGFGMPSSKTLDFSLGESGGPSYTMPADGYLHVTADSVDTKGNIVIANNTTSINTSTTATYSGFTMYAVAPVRKGDVVKVWFNYSTLKRVRFNYAEGSK